MPISPLSGPFAPQAIDSQATLKPALPKSSVDFRAVLEQTINHVERSRAAAQDMANSFVNGGSEELHSVAIASQRAELEFDLLLQVRNKMVSAYQEVMKMQV